MGPRTRMLAAHILWRQTSLPLALSPFSPHSFSILSPFFLPPPTSQALPEERSQQAAIDSRPEERSKPASKPASNRRGASQPASQPATGEEQASQQAGQLAGEDSSYAAEMGPRTRRWRSFNRESAGRGERGITGRPVCRVFDGNEQLR